MDSLNSPERMAFRTRILVSWRCISAHKADCAPLTCRPEPLRQTVPSYRDMFGLRTYFRRSAIRAEFEPVSSRAVLQSTRGRDASLFQGRLVLPLTEENSKSRSKDEGRDYGNKNVTQHKIVRSKCFSTSEQLKQCLPNNEGGK